MPALRFTRFAASPAFLAAALFALSSLFVSYDDARAQHRDGEWTLIGTREVDVRDRAATIELAQAKGRFTAFSITSGRSRFTVERTRFFFKDGNWERTVRRIYLRPGDRSPSLAAASAGREVIKAELVFRVGRGGRGKREVEIWGLQSEAERRAAPAPQEVAAKQDDKPIGVGVGAAAQDLLAKDTMGAEDTAAGGAGGAGDQTQAQSTAPQVPAPAQTPPELQTLTDIDQGPPPLPGRVLPQDTIGAGDVLLGARSVGLQDDRDFIKVGQRLGKFARMRLRVEGQDVTFKRLTIDYRNGGADVVPLDTTIRPQTQSDWIDVKPDRFIDRIQFSYEPKPGVTARARVEAFGEHAAGWLGADGEGRRYNDGWVLLAAQTAGFVGFENDTISVDDKEGGFKTLRLQVRERAITLNTIKVVYGDGKEDEIPVKARVDAGSSYGPIELSRPNDRIARIEARYRSRFSDRKATSDGSAIVEFWARH